MIAQNARPMNGGPNTSDALPPDTSATEALENAVEESRREYDKKVETMEEIDDKAMRSVQTAVILVGLVVSAVSVGGPGAVGEATVLPVLFGALGVVALAVSIVFGIGVYSVTEYPTGISSVHRDEATTGGYTKDEWVVSVLDNYDEWSAIVAEEIERMATYFEFVQLFLSFGVVSLLVSASMVVFRIAYGVRPFLIFVVAIVLVTTVRTYLVYKD
ncbi:hypothetical protein [Halorussus ruber]|uniref:hypothetical protein n=1 Tax=Halorussus ruber TaxID=1126238 RepID=UPI0010920F93|nr:hypothetical protein [Halorussus ruber]